MYPLKSITEVNAAALKAVAAAKPLASNRDAGDTPIAVSRWVAQGSRFVFRFTTCFLPCLTYHTHTHTHTFLSPRETLARASQGACKRYSPLMKSFPIPRPLQLRC